MGTGARGGGKRRSAPASVSCRGVGTGVRAWYIVTMPMSMLKEADLADPSRLTAALRANLAAFERRPVAAPDGVRRAAVCLTVVPFRDEPHVLVIKRAPRGRNAGQWALPGGRLDEGETEEAAALRELREETAVEAGPHEVVGLLDDFHADSGFVITPLVVVPEGPVHPRPAPDEVQSLHHVPLRRLMQPDLPHWATAPDGGPLLQMPLRPGMVIHAPTGALLWQFREAALLGRATRVDTVTQPAFTRR